MVGFEDELEILDNYFITLGSYAEMEEPELRGIVDDDSLPVSHPTRTTLDHLDNLFHEVAVHLEGTEQADDGMGNSLAHLGKRAELGHGCVRNPVKTTSDLLEHAAVAQALEVRSRDAHGVEITRADWSFSSQSEQCVGLGWCDAWHDTKCCSEIF